jgi:hypothetical protein
MVPSKSDIRVITLEDNNWVTTDVKYRALRSDVEAHLKTLYPWVHDARKNLMLRKYKIEVRDSSHSYTFMLTCSLVVTERRSPYMGGEQIAGCKLFFKLRNVLRSMAIMSTDQPIACGAEPGGHEQKQEEDL